MKTMAEVRERVAIHPDWSDRRLSSSLNVPISMIREARNTESPQRPSAKPPGKSVADLIDQFDEVKKIKSRMGDLPRDSYLDDDEMRRLVGIGIDRWKTVIQSAEVSKFRFQLPKGKFVWMHLDSQQKLAAAINMDGV